MMGRYIDWEDVFVGLGFTALASLLVLLLVIAVAPHKIDGYYVSQYDQGRSCVYAHWTWHTDERAFCSENPQTVLDYAVKANTLVKESK